MDLLTANGKNILRRLCYDVKCKKQSLRDDNVDMGSYAFQAIQQREIAIESLFDGLFGHERGEQDYVYYFDYLAKNHKKLKLPVDKSLNWNDNLTHKGLHQALSLYEEDLIKKQSAWHDGVFEYLPKVESIGDIQECTVNTNYLERQQGYKVAFNSLKIPVKLYRNIEDDVRNSVYTRIYDEHGSNVDKKLAYFEDYDLK